MSERAAHEVGIVDYPGAQVACILGLTDLFRIACTIALDQRRSGQNRASRHALEAHRCLRHESFMHLRQRTARQPTAADVNHPADHGGPQILIYLPALFRGFVTVMPPAPPWFPCARARLSLPQTGLMDGQSVCHASDVRNGAGEAFSENRRRHKSAHH